MSTYEASPSLHPLENSYFATKVFLFGKWSRKKRRKQGFGRKSTNPQIHKSTNPQIRKSKSPQTRGLDSAKKL